MAFVCLVSCPMGIRLDREIIGEPILWTFGYFYKFSTFSFPKTLQLLSRCSYFGVGGKRELEITFK